ncbi:Thiol-disulfide oxidoreductase ResA [Neolewinella maritima]|uniref:Thiol-disulfide oxidoreductase ResA n=1 Tax=Neolewinella maritima TaxID=1383882 RepID=A0ABM9B2D6_9BACT|nr:TlpA disulfide reductase family protein [Neolewinella maritima]CAH1001504.1 Thiol-disulfide oxidoreductase ResA [Neolewinella maritima]
MLRILLLLCVLTTGTLTAQRQVTLTAELADCTQPIQLFRFTGFGFEPLLPLAERPDGSYQLSLSIPEPVFRYIGTDASNAVPIILGGEDSLTLHGNCEALRQATVGGSAINTAYVQLKADFEAFNERYTTLIQDIQVIQDERVNREGKEAMRQLDQDKRELVARMAIEYPLLGRVASLNTYLSYYSADQEQYPSEVGHYAQTYFQFVDFTDPGYDDLSWTFEGTRGFTTTLLKALPADEIADVILEQTAHWPAGGKARFLARSGALGALFPAKHPATMPVARALIDEYEDSEPGAIAFVKQQTAGLASFIIGAPAPLFTAPTPAGEELSLESLRGQVVLLDFWASWCGPCRRENPNVVKMYHKYKDRGFEILGVSLDDRRERWEGAIAADKLDWLHVSDLQGWQSAYGQLYGVTSIPQTVLLDRDGTILARNLRGAELERKLAEVLGSR